MDNWLLVFVGCLFLIFMIIGFIRGAIKIVVSLAATIVTLIVVVIATPYVSNVMYKVLPVKDMVQSECRSFLIREAKEGLSSGLVQKVAELTGINLQEAGIAPENFNWENYGISDQQVEEMLGKLELPRELQIQTIEKAGLPEYLTEKLLENNNSEVYKQLGVESFVDYIGAYLAKIIVDILAFLITFLVVTILVRTIMYALNIIGDLPVLHGLNRVAGAFLGMGTALVIVWVLFMIITLSYRTGFGKASMDMIDKSPLLTFLYDHNYIMNAIIKFH